MEWGDRLKWAFGREIVEKKRNSQSRRRASEVVFQKQADFFVVVCGGRRNWASEVIFRKRYSDGPVGSGRQKRVSASPVGVDKLLQSS